MDFTSTGHFIRTVEATDGNRYFFSPSTLKFFGERRSEMRLLKRVELVEDHFGNEHYCYVLSSYQRKHPLGARRVHHYFDVETLEHVLVD